MDKKWFLNNNFYDFEENRPVREIVIEALLEYFSKPRKSDRNRLIQLLTTPIEGASAEDYKEYEYDDI
ncbi:MAG: hypothetical protein QXX32_02940 [Thermofilum sp.]|uniref:Uncharacterized protein n=1 Tax=Thermofilum adornatum TaxID=1365176 RepID=S5ZW12_9CREN|nr:hypothetical protein [Thermofilum adornatum]AGT35359.1 hypothetical protein N186_05065 [Thermofilum adornatum]